jgi:hypothetical protein
MSEGGLHEDEDLTEAMHERVRQELVSGERLLWKGRPLARAMGPGCGVKAVVLLVIVPVAVGAGLLLWAWEARRADDRFGFGIGLIIAGGVLSLLMSWANRVARRARENTFYVLTDRRAITWAPELGGQIAVRSYYPQDIQGLHRKESPDGSGSVILSEVGVPGHKGAMTLQPRGFLGIARVREVEQKVRDTLLSPRQEG